MNELTLLLYLFILVLFGTVLGMKVTYIVFCLKTNQFNIAAKIYAATIIVTLWIVYITGEVIMKGLTS